MTDPSKPLPPVKSDETGSGPSKNRKRKKSQSSATFWYLLITGIFLAFLFYSVTETRRGKELKYSEFINGLNDGKTYTKDNVHEFTFGNDYYRFQNLPRPKTNDDGTVTPAPASDNALKYYTIAASSLTEKQQEDLAKALDAHGIAYSGTGIQTDAQTVMYLIFLVIFVVFFIMLMRRMSSAGGALSFGRSRGKLYEGEETRVTFEQVAGIEEAVEELREIVEFLKTPAKYQSLGGRIPKGVLLIGPPGTGKTLLAKAVAGEAEVPFFSLSGSDFVEMFVGVGAARVRDMFQQAVAQSPAIIFIDELDALGKTRGTGMPGGHDEREQTLNALLVEMDGFASDQSVIVMGATNRPETLDPALMRPGRFDRHVLVDKPDYKGREAILRVHTSKVKMDVNVDLSHLAKLTPGFSGADLSNLVNEAALLAARKDKKSVHMHDFEEAIERLVAGLQKSTRLIMPDEKQRVAYHESGHALVACVLPNTDPVHKISIIPRGMGALGYMMQRPQDERFLVTQSELENKICVCLGGIATEQMIYNETSTGAQNDLERATDIARRMVTEFGMSPKLGRVNYHQSNRSPFLANYSAASDALYSEATIREIDLEIKRIIDHMHDVVVDILKTHRPALEHITKDLMELEVMDASHLESILKQYKTGPQIKPGTFVEPHVQPEAKPHEGQTPGFSSLG
jgi:cell division protease FtsH